MLTGQPFYSNLRNADGSVGIKPEADSATVNLSIEQRALLSVISTATGQLTFNAGRLLVEAEIDVSDISIGAVEIKDGIANNRVTVRADSAEFAMVVSQNSQPLPAGASTEATLSTLATEATLALIKAKTDNLDALLSTLATASSQTTGNASLSSIDTKLSGPFDVLDRYTREIGKVSGSDVIYVTETYTTTNSNSQTRPINGDFITRAYKTKELVIENTGGANSARVTVSGSVDGGATFPMVISNNTLLAAGNVIEVAETRGFTHIRVFARASSAGNQTTIRTSGYAQGI